MPSVEHGLEGTCEFDAGNGNGTNSTRREGGSKTRLLSLDDLDRRTRAFQTAHEMKNAIISDLGGLDQLSTLELIQAENAAVDAAVLRDLQVRWLRGEEVEAAILATVENVFNRTAAALGTKRRPREVLPTLPQFVDGLARQEAAGESAVGEGTFATSEAAKRTGESANPVSEGDQ